MGPHKKFEANRSKGLRVMIRHTKKHTEITIYRILFKNSISFEKSYKTFVIILIDYSMDI